MACHTQEAIAQTLDCERSTVDHVLREMATLPKSAEPVADHLTDFEVPLFNVWKFQTKADASAHAGNTDIRIVDRLLYLYTQPFDVVVDPFAGGGSTLDVCRKRFRRCWVSDRKPIVERERDIQWDGNGKALGQTLCQI